MESVEMEYKADSVVSTFSMSYAFIDMSAS